MRAVQWENIRTDLGTWLVLYLFFPFVSVPACLCYCHICDFFFAESIVRHSVSPPLSFLPFLLPLARWLRAAPSIFTATAFANYPLLCISKPAEAARLLSLEIGLSASLISCCDMVTARFQDGWIMLSSLWPAIEADCWKTTSFFMKWPVRARTGFSKHPQQWEIWKAYQAIFSVTNVHPAFRVLRRKWESLVQQRVSPVIFPFISISGQITIN